MRRQRCWGERKGRSVSVTFFSRRLVKRAGWRPRRGGWRRTGRRAGRRGDGPLAPRRQSRRGPGRTLQSRVAAAVEAESGCPQEPAQQAERPCPTWNQNGRTSTSLLDLITSPRILPKRGLGCTFGVGALPDRPAYPPCRSSCWIPRWGRPRAQDARRACPTPLEEAEALEGG